VEHLRVLELVLHQHLIDFCRVELRDYNILIILWLRLGNLILTLFGLHLRLLPLTDDPVGLHKLPTG
jgi:hypothetical protein